MAGLFDPNVMRDLIREPDPTEGQGLLGKSRFIEEQLRGNPFGEFAMGAVGAISKVGKPMQQWMDAVSKAANKGEMDVGQGSIGAAYRLGRSNPAAKPGYIVPNTLADAAWQVGKKTSKARREYDSLPGVTTEAPNDIGSLVEYAGIELERHAAGEGGLTAAQVRKLNNFVTKWRGG